MFIIDSIKYCWFCGNIDFEEYYNNIDQSNINEVGKSTNGGMISEDVDGWQGWSNIERKWRLGGMRNIWMSTWVGINHIE